MACPHAPILLSPWPILGDSKSKARNVSWSATFVGGATDPAVADDVPCNRTRKVDVTRIGRGSAVQGTAEMPEECKAQVRSMRVWVHNDPRTYVKVQDLADGEQFRVSGLPPGQHTLDAKGIQFQVIVGGGQTVIQNVTFPCVGDEPSLPPPTPDPSTPTPTDTASPTPSESPTASTTSAPATSLSPTP